MANLTEDGNHTTAHELFCARILQDMHQRIFISAINIPLSITAFLANVLIIAALQKVTSVHSPTKLLFRSLAITDLCVGLITQPLFVSYLMSPEHSGRCYYLRILFYTIGTFFSSVSCLTALPAISVDRLLALLLGLRYRCVVTLRRVRVIVIIVWLASATTTMTLFYDETIFRRLIFIGLLLCILTSTVCYAKIYHTLRHRQTQIQDHAHQGQPNGRGISLNMSRYRKTVSSALWVQMALLACYLPYGIVKAIFLITGVYPSFLNLMFRVTLSLVYLNSSLNPFLYCWKIRALRQAVKDTIRQFFCSSS